MTRPLLPDPAPSRIVGVDVARALALVGMMATHMLPGIVDDRVTWNHQLAAGRASAVFALLAGVSVALVSGRTQPVRGRARYAASSRLLVRVVLVGSLGLALGMLPTTIAVILAYYAVLFLLGLPFLGLRAPALAVAAAVWFVAAPVASHWLRPHLPQHEIGSPTPEDLLEPGRLLNELLFVGYYPAAVWLAYLLAGMALGRIDLRRKVTGVALMVSGVLIAVAATLVSRALLRRPEVHDALTSTYPDPTAAGDPQAFEAALARGLHGTTPTESWWWLATVAPHSGTPFDLAQTTGSAMAVLGACLLLTRLGPRVWAAVFGAGAMTLSLYSLHLLMMASGYWPDWEAPDHYGDQVLVVLGVGAFFALVPLRGPLEAVVAVLSRLAARAPGRADAQAPPRHTRAGR